MTTQSDEARAADLAVEAIAVQHGPLDYAEKARAGNWPIFRAARTAALAALTAPKPEVREALKCAIDHIEHMAAWIGANNRGYSFEALGEDMPDIRAALSRADKPAEVRDGED